MMDCYILHLETSGKICSVAISNQNKLLAIKESNESAFVHAELITVFIEQVLQESSITAQQLNAVSVTSGPGSYTGLRIGVSTAKGLCFALQIPLISVDALLNLAVLAKQKHPNSKKICSMIDARRMEVYMAIYNQDLEIIQAISAEVIDETSFRSHDPMLLVGDGSYKLTELWKDRKIQFDLAIKSSARGHISLAHQKYIAKDFEDVAYFEPFYLKEFFHVSKKK